MTTTTYTLANENAADLLTAASIRDMLNGRGGIALTDDMREQYREQLDKAEANIPADLARAAWTEAAARDPKAPSRPRCLHGFVARTSSASRPILTALLLRVAPGQPGIYSGVMPQRGTVPTEQGDTMSTIAKITSTIHDMMIMSGASGGLASNIAEIVTTIIRENPKVLHMIADPVISDDTINGLVSKAFEIRRHSLHQAIDNPAEFAAFISAN